MNPAIARMSAETGPGRCICCDRPLPPKEPGVNGRQRKVCRDDRECWRTYHAIYRSGRREEKEQRANLVHKPGCELARVLDEARAFVAKSKSDEPSKGKP